MLDIVILATMATKKALGVVEIKNRGAISNRASLSMGISSSKCTSEAVNKSLVFLWMDEANRK